MSDETMTSTESSAVTTGDQRVEIAAPKTCATCAHIGQHYHGGDWNPIHFCGMSDVRRNENFRSCGDGAQDFMNEFRKFYDAGPDCRACAHYSEREPLSAERSAVLQTCANAGGRALFKFFSEENRLAEKMKRIFLNEDTQDAERNGFRAYTITKIGRAALSAQGSPVVAEPSNEKAIVP